MIPVRITLLPHVASLACAVSLAAIGLPMRSVAADPPPQETSAVLSGRSSPFHGQA
jgi:hypothetical protein